MSALDKAFLKAYTSGGAAAGGAAADPAVSPIPESQPAISETAAAQPTGPSDATAFRRIDLAHGAAGAGVPTPHAGLAIPADCVELPSGPPMCEVIGPPAELPLKPASLKLPTMFLAPEETRHKPFSPEWEVDRFNWPELCQRLLEIQSRYFRHVGQRLKAATDDSHHVVMISGCRRGEGRTTLSLCLARSAAEAGVLVALLDADLQNPQLSTRLGMQAGCGWLDVLTGELPLNGAAVTSLKDRLTLFPLKPSQGLECPADDRRLIHILHKISAHYPLVIVDTGPLDQPRHAFAGNEPCPIDAAIVVRDLRYTSQTTTMAAAVRLQESGISAVGIAENFAVP